MKLSVVLFLVLATLSSAQNEKRNMRRKAAPVSEEEYRFLNVFDEEDEDEVNTRYVVKFKSHAAMMRSQKKSSATPVLMTFDKFDMEVVNIASDDELKEWEEDEDVVKIELDQKRYLLNSIPERKLQEEEIPYGINMVNALDVSDENVSNMRVCIIDTGYDIAHPDLPSSSNVSGNNNRGNQWSEDGNGHGTHVAGTIAAVGDNGIGVVGVNRNGEIGLHIERLFGDNGRPIFGSTIMGLANACVEAGSTVISMSLGGPIGMDLERELFKRIHEEDNVLVVAAAGNGGNTRYSYPASYPAVMSVAAIDSDQDLAFFSQRNDQVDIAAPGVAVLSTETGGGYVAYSGTSMACPHVAGVGALVWSHFPDTSSVDIRNALTATAIDLGTPGRDDSYGYGLVQADRAYLLLSGELTLSPTIAPTPERPCFNDPENFRDSRGKRCTWYARGLFDRCALFGNSRANEEGIGANDACCTCGGGRFEVEESPTSSPVVLPTSSPVVISVPTPSPSSSPTECVDVDGWENSRGRDCAWFAGFSWWRCMAYGNRFRNDGLVANEACCVCK